MSIKDLFNKKVVVFKSAESASVDVESLDYMLNKSKEHFQVVLLLLICLEKEV